MSKLEVLAVIKTHHKQLPGKIFFLTSDVEPLTIDNVVYHFQSLESIYVIDIICGNKQSAIITAFKSTSQGENKVERKKGFQDEDSYIINTWLINKDRYELNDNIIIDKNTLQEQGLFHSGYRMVNFSYEERKVNWCKSFFTKPDDMEFVLDSYQNGLSNRGGTNVSSFIKYDNAQPEFESEMLFCKSCVHYFSKHNVVKSNFLRCPYCEELSLTSHMPVVWFQPDTLNVVYKDTYELKNDISHGLESIIQLKIENYLCVFVILTHHTFLTFFNTHLKIHNTKQNNNTLLKI